MSRPLSFLPSAMMRLSSSSLALLVAAMLQHTVLGTLIAYRIEADDAACENPVALEVSRHGRGWRRRRRRRPIVD